MKKTNQDVRKIIATKEKDGVKYIQKGCGTCYKVTPTEYVKISKAKFASL